MEALTSFYTPFIKKQSGNNLTYNQRVGDQVINLMRETFEINYY